jgi:hypothetical protein
MIGPGHLDGYPGCKMGRIIGQPGSLALGTDDQTAGRLDFHLDVPVKCDGKGVEAGTEVGSRCWGSCSHTDTVAVMAWAR